MNRYAGRDGSRRKNPRKARYQAEAWERLTRRAMDDSHRRFVAMMGSFREAFEPPRIEVTSEPRVH